MTHQNFYSGALNRAPLRPKNVWELQMSIGGDFKEVPSNPYSSHEDGNKTLWQLRIYHLRAIVLSPLCLPVLLFGSPLQYSRHLGA